MYFVFKIPHLFLSLVYGRFRQCHDHLVKTTTKKLFLYSQKDEIVRAEDVEMAIREAKKGSICCSFDFKDSDHCSHMRKYPKIYEKQVMNFIDLVTKTKTKTK